MHEADAKYHYAARLTDWSRAHILPLAASVLLFGALLSMYFGTNTLAVAFPEMRQHPFGADVPTYVFGPGMPDMHWLVTKLLIAYRRVVIAFGFLDSPIWIKAPFALLGAMNFAVAIAAFSSLTGKFGARSILFALSFALALTPWYYASVPESYALSTLFYSLYVLGLVHAARHGLSTGLGIAMAAVFWLGLYNDVSIVFLAVTPIVLFGRTLLDSPTHRKITVIHAVAFGLFVIENILNRNFIEHYLSFFLEYAPFSEARSFTREYDFDLIAAASNFFLYSLGAPQATVSYAPWHALPAYSGYFAPSPTAYLASPNGVLFLAMYLALLCSIRISRFTKLITGLIAFVFARFALVVATSPRFQ